MKNKIAAKVLAVQIILCMLFSSVMPVFATVNTITISSKEDFIKFAKNCTLDTWSRGKTVNLTCDIDFSGDDFAPIATFGGTFNGNGHTVSGVDFCDKGSYQGVFRYVQQSGKVSELNVKGKFAPGGSKSFIGGIAGENSGTIENCSFTGNIKGENVIGGIAGNNTDYGQILSCTVSGIISGENSTGGIAGKSSGFISNCTNEASVNIVFEEKRNNLSNIDADTEAIFESYINIEEENEEETALGHTDTGGIVGYSSGIVQGCVNNADIGYQHVGYNVGGIAGRQSGYMIGCENYGYIQGRKDVGGIVGQAEPYVSLSASESLLKQLRTEINSLNTMVDKLITDTDDLSDKAEKYLDNISDYAKDAGENAEILVDEGTDFANDNLGKLNAEAAFLSNVLDQIESAFDKVDDAKKDVTNAFDVMIDALKDIGIRFPDLGDAAADIIDTVSDISKAEKNAEKLTLKLNKAQETLDAAVKTGDSEKAEKAMADMSAAVKIITAEKQTTMQRVRDIELAVKNSSGGFESAGIDTDKVLSHLENIRINTGDTVVSLQTVTQNLDAVKLGDEIDFSDFESVAQAIKDAIEHIGGSMGDIKDELQGLADILKKLSSALSDSIKHLSYAADDIKAAVKNIREVIEDLANKKPIKFVKLNSNFKTASDNLFDSLSGISDELDGLGDMLSDEQDEISGDLTAINNQFNLVLNLIIDEFEKFENGDYSLSDIFVDVSDEDIESTRLGKVADCRNFGEINADRNTGGIAGAIAIEYAKDPEDDIEKPNTLSFTYNTKAIVQSCINNGNVTGKKDCIGGIAGFSKIGVIYACQNYAEVESTGGNYVGGITGKSEASVRKSYAKGRLTGERYVGGIAGKANVISSCYTIVNVNGDESIGAVCGDCEELESLQRNFYVDNGLGAVDGISYEGKAQPIAFDDLRNMANIPSRFISFIVTFVADDEVVATQDIEYGEDTDRIKYPEIPTKKGCFGNWQKPESETVIEDIEVVCEYQPYITVISSEERNETGKLALALAEGEFTDKAKLHIVESDENPPVKTVGDIIVYDVMLLNSDIKEDEEVTLRILNENRDKVTAWRLDDGEWTKIKVSDNGKYAIMHGVGDESTICVKYEERSIVIVFVAAAATAAAAVLCVLKIRKIRGQKKEA